jgi:hypothetical protein
MYQILGKQEVEKLLMRHMKESDFKKAISIIDKDGMTELKPRGTSKDVNMRGTATSKMSATSGKSSLQNTNNFNNEDKKFETGISFNSTNFTGFKKAPRQQTI